MYPKIDGKLAGPTLAILLFALYSAVALFPSPADLLANHGHGYQLAGASEILAGRHPFIDFRDVYGPLAHYASALGQWLAGGRVGGELVLVVASLVVGYVLLFRLMIKCNVPVGLALAATALAIWVQPVAFRYYLFLLPMVFFTAAWWYVEAPSVRRLAVLGATVTGAGLFRPDLGAFTFASGVVLLLAGAGDFRQRVGRVIAFAAIVLAWALPWLGWLAAHGKVWEYLINSSAGALTHNAGMAKPLPSFTWSAGLWSEQNAKAWFFRLPAVMSVLIIVMAWIRRAELQGSLRAKIAAAIAFALLTQAQASHIIDWMHVRDTFPIRLLLLAWIVAPVAPGLTLSRARLTAEKGARGFAGLVAISLMIAAVNAREWQTPLAPSALVEKLSAYRRSRAGFLDYLRQRNETYRADMYAYVREHSRPEESIFAVTESPQANYFTDRRLAGSQLAILPGFFSSPEDQRRLITEIRAGPTAFVIVDHLYERDYPGLTLKTFAPEFLAFLDEEFVPEMRFGNSWVLRPRGRPGPTVILPRNNPERLQRQWRATLESLSVPGAGPRRSDP